MGNPTANYQFLKPTDGGDPDIWALDYASGDPMVDPSPGLNGNWSKMDLLMQDAIDRLAAVEQSIENVPEEAEKARIPVGGLLFFATEVDVAALVGYGTWQLVNSGQVLVGEGGGYTAGQTGGVTTVTLTSSQMPAHTHSCDPPSTTSSSNGSHSHSSFTGATGSAFSAESGVSTGRSSGGRTTSTNGAHTHTLNVGSFTSGSSGSGQSHNNQQPSKVAAMYRRTA